MSWGALCDILGGSCHFLVMMSDYVLRTGVRSEFEKADEIVFAGFEKAVRGKLTFINLAYG